jgi:anti-sigma regulatory factor (Ser/Thr protein kinase)
VNCALDAIGVSDECRDDVTLALTEVCSNVVRHAHESDDYTVTVTATANRCTIDVCDSGTGLPRDVAETERPRSSPPSATNQPFSSPPSATNRVFSSPPSATNQLLQPGSTAEHGRGLSIVRAVMDSVQVVAGPSGVAIHMVKQLIFGKCGYVLPVPRQM